MVASALVCGAGGFIGGHLVKRLKSEGLWVRGADLKRPEHASSAADEFLLGDLRDPAFAARATDQPFDEVYQLAADMGGAGFIFTGANDAAIRHNNTLIDLNVLEACRARHVTRVFYASSARVYPVRNQATPEQPICAEDSAYPAEPDSAYGWAKLLSEQAYLAYYQTYGLGCRIARYHNVFGPEGPWCGGREKAPAALCRKVAQAPDSSTIEVWGDGNQTRSFLYIDDAIEATVRLMRSDHTGPINIGSEEMVTINDLTRTIIAVSGKTLAIRNVPGPVGVQGRNSDNRRIAQTLGWQPVTSLRSGLALTYPWIRDQLTAKGRDRASATAE